MKKAPWDWLILIIPFILCVVGIVSIFSITHQTSGLSYFIQQAIYLIVGLVFFVVFSFIDYRALKGAAPVLYVIGTALLAAVVLFGPEIQGSSRWISLGFFNFQPSEIFKIILVVSLAAFISSQENINPKQFIALGLLTLIPIGLVVIEPDLGTSLLYLAIFLIFVIFSQIERIYLFFLSGLAIITAPIMWLFVLADYQKERILSFFYPQSDPFGAGYNVLQSTIAIGSGGLLGKGLGHGPQSQLNFLPSQHTDFIFATISEELGFWGASLVLVLLLAFLFRGIKVAKNSQDDFGRFLAIGFVSVFLFQILINVGMNLGLMPVTGIALPFVSYGGSSLITSFIMAGVLNSIYIRRSKLNF